MDEQLVCWEALMEFEQCVEREFGRVIDAIVVYGSVARGEATADSDTDIMLIGKNIARYKKHISLIRTDIDLKHGTLTALIYRTPNELEQAIECGDPFIHKVFLEGKSLYDNGTYGRLRTEIPTTSITVLR